MRVNRIVAGYVAGVVTTFAAIAAGQAWAGSRAASFDQLDVHRLNLREPDGTLRMVISDRAEFPGFIVKGRDIPHPSRNDSAGMLFFNDEGTENGGLVFGGRKTGGKVTSFGHLSFDQYEQDQVLTLDQSENEGARTAGIGVNDRPAQPLDFALIARLDATPAGPAREALMHRLEVEGAQGTQRAFLGKDKDRDSRVVLRDAQGRARLLLNVTAAGAASIAFLDQQGKIVRSLGPTQ